MTGIAVPLDQITGTDFSTTPDVWLGTRNGDSEVVGMARFPSGIPYDLREIDRRLSRHNVTLGDLLTAVTDESGAVWVDLHTSWAEDDPRWLLTEAGEAALIGK